MDFEHQSGERLDKKVVKKETVHRRFLSTPIGPEKQEHWFEADYEVTYYDDGTQRDSLVPGTLKDLGRAETKAEKKAKIEPEFKEHPLQEKKAA